MKVLLSKGITDLILVVQVEPKHLVVLQGPGLILEFLGGSITYKQDN